MSRIGGLIAGATSTDLDELRAATQASDRAAREMLAIAHDHITRLEQALAKAHDDLAVLEGRLDDERERATDEAQHHAVEMGEMRSALLHLSVQLAREIRRGGGA